MIVRKGNVPHDRYTSNIQTKTKFVIFISCLKFRIGFKCHTRPTVIFFKKKITRRLNRKIINLYNQT